MITVEHLEDIDKAKEEKKISTATISMLSNASLPTVTRFFQGNGKRLSVDTVASIANVLGVSLDEAFGIGEIKQKPLDPNVEAIINSYTELIKEKDARLTEQEETIKNLRIDKLKIQRNNTYLIIFTVVVVLICIFISFVALTH